jgi:hypothetical protein
MNELIAWFVSDMRFQFGDINREIFVNIYKYWLGSCLEIVSELEIQLYAVVITVAYAYAQHFIIIYNESVPFANDTMFNAV